MIRARRFLSGLLAVALLATPIGLGLAGLIR